MSYCHKQLGVLSWVVLHRSVYAQLVCMSHETLWVIKVLSPQFAQGVPCWI